MSQTIKLVAKLKDNLSGPLGRTGRSLRNFGKTAIRAGAAVGVLATAVFVAAKKLADYGAAIQDMSDATGIGVMELQGLTYGIEQAGGSAQNLSMALRTQARFIGYVSQGLQSYTQYLDDLGITYEELEGLSPEETFLTLTDALAGVTNEVRKTEIGMILFGGRGMSSILSAMEQFDGSLRNAQAQFEELGYALSTEQVANLKQFSDAMTDLDFRFKAFLADAIVPMLPVIEDMADRFLEIAEDKLPMLIGAVEDAIPVIIAMVDALALAAEGWSKLIGEDVKTEVDAAADAFRALGESLESQVAAGMLTALEAAQAYHEESEALIKSFSDNVIEQAILRGSTEELALSFNFAEAALRELLGVMDFGGMMTDLGDSFKATGENIIGMLIDTEALGEALLNLTPPEGPITPPGTISDDDLEDTLEKLTTIKDRQISDLEEIQAMQEGAINRREETEQAAIERRKQQAIAAVEERRTIEQSIADERERTEQRIKGIGIAGWHEIAGIMSNNAFDWEEQVMRALARMAIQAAAIKIGGIGGGILGFIGGLFQGGGTIEHAQGGMITSGSGILGDRHLILGETGEKFTKREQVIAERLEGNRGRGNVILTVHYSPTLSTASQGEAVKLAAELVPILQQAGVDI